MFVSGGENLLIYGKLMSDPTQEHSRGSSEHLPGPHRALLSAPFSRGTFALLPLFELFFSQAVDRTFSAGQRVHFWLSPKEGTFWGSSNLKFSSSYTAKHPFISAFRGHTSDKGLSSNT